MIRREFLTGASLLPLACLALKPADSHSIRRPGEPRASNPEFHSDDLWQRIREQFLMAEDYVYFNAGGLGPTPTLVIDKIAETLRDLQIQPQHGHNLIEEARPVVAQFVGCDPRELAFQRNATEGTSTIACGLSLQKGDEIILDSHAHQGGCLPWLTRQLYSGIVVKIFEPDPTNVDNNLARIQQLITAKTKVIQVSHVTAPTGIRLPVASIGKLARDQGIWFHVDGAQSLGMFPFRISDLNCDSFAAGCHKWMSGPLGTGVLYIRHNRQCEVQPTEVGSYADAEWDLPSKLVLEDSARRYECGTRDCASVVGLVESIQLLKRLEMAKIAVHGDRLAQFLREGLVENAKLVVLSPELAELRSSMVSFQFTDQSCDGVFGQLQKLGFRCRPVRERNLNAVRISTHFFNTLDECERLIATINRL